MMQKTYSFTPAILLLTGFLIAGCEGETGDMTDVDQQTTAEQSREQTTTTDRQNATAESSTESAANDSAWSEPQAEATPDCANCGTITAIEPAVAKGEGTGIGVVAGGVVGGIVGNQFGGGTGKKIATVAGAVGGAFAGHEAEKYARAETYYAVSVDLDSGGTQTVKIANGEALRVGQKVRVDGNDLYVQ
ncbi:MAG: glycine zipper 2TM domain-containing protein [Gammaproteobacteria bacterium]